MTCPSPFIDAGVAERQQADPETLRSILNYDPITGSLTWKMRPAAMFTAQRYANAWNAKWDGRPALSHVNPEGYLHGSIFGRLYRAHRVAYALHHGRWPEHDVDHINGVKSDNRIENLRDVTNAQNHRNRRLSKRNTTGASGVFFCQKKGVWRAQIRIDGGRKKSLGHHATLEAAVAARRSAEAEFGYHPNHGRHA